MLSYFIGAAAYLTFKFCQYCAHCVVRGIAAAHNTSSRINNGEFEFKILKMKILVKDRNEVSVIELK